MNAASLRYRRAKQEVELARAELIDVVVAAQKEGWTQRRLEEVLPISRITINTWTQTRRRSEKLGNQGLSAED